MGRRSIGRMIIAVDIGNSAAKAALVEGGRVHAAGRLDTTSASAADLAEGLRALSERAPARPERIVAVSVVDRWTDRLGPRGGVVLGGSCWEGCAAYRDLQGSAHDMGGSVPAPSREGRPAAMRAMPRYWFTQSWASILVGLGVGAIVVGVAGAGVLMLLAAEIPVPSPWPRALVAAALIVAGRAGDLTDGVALARESIDSGAARDRVHRLAALTRNA